MFKKFINSNIFFTIVLGIFLIGMAFAATERKGKDLKIFLFGVQQTLKHQSPYERFPQDTERPLYLYAPGFLIFQYSFVLKSKMISPVAFTDLEFRDITPSILAWYFVEVLALVLCAFLLLKLIPSVSNAIRWRNLKFSFLMALPLIGYEFSNCQSKIIALFFMLLAIMLFEKNRVFLCAFFFNLALMIYIPLIFFLLYFILRDKKWFLLSFLAGGFIVFFALPTLVFGYDYNLFLLNQWFLRCIKPFALAQSYETYRDLRVSSQSLPSAIGRLFVVSSKESFKYFLSPVLIHWVIKFFTALLVLLSCFAAWKNKNDKYRGLSYGIFFLLALLLPKYTITYTWAWLFVFYFVILNYVSYSNVSKGQKNFLISLLFFIFFSSLLVGIRTLGYFSLLFWATLFLWAGIVYCILDARTAAPVSKKIEGIHNGL